MKTGWILSCMFAIAAGCLAQPEIPEGTKVRVRLEQTLSSASASQGQAVQLSVVDEVKVGDTVAIAPGANVTGTVKSAESKKRAGRAGKLEFSIDRITVADGSTVPVRFAVQTEKGHSDALRNGIITGGATVLAGPIGLVGLLWKGKDATLNRGTTFEVFTDRRHTLSLAANGPRATPPAQPANGAVTVLGRATVTVTSDPPGAEIRLDGVYVGNTPSTLQMPEGARNLLVRKGSSAWERSLQVHAGSSVSVHADLAQN